MFWGFSRSKSWRLTLLPFDALVQPNVYLLYCTLFLLHLLYISNVIATMFIIVTAQSMVSSILSLLEQSWISTKFHCLVFCRQICIIIVIWLLPHLSFVQNKLFSLNLNLWKFSCTNFIKKPPTHSRWLLAIKRSVNLKSGLFAKLFADQSARLNCKNLNFERNVQRKHCFPFFLSVLFLLLWKITIEIVGVLKVKI